MRSLDDIRPWHLHLALLVAVTIHTMALTLYLNVLPFLSRPPPSAPPIVVLRTPPPATPTQMQQRLPKVALPRAVPRTPPPVVQSTPAPAPVLPTVALPKPEAPPKPEELPKLEEPPKPLEAVPAPKPVTKAIPVEKKIAEPPARSPSPASAVKTKGSERTVDDLTPAEKHKMLIEYYVDNKNNWPSSVENRDQALAWFGLGFIDPTWVENQPELYGEGGQNVVDHGPLPGEVDPTWVENQPELYGQGGQHVDDHGPLPGEVDPTSPPDIIDLCGDRSDLAPTNAGEFCELSPMTVQEARETLKKMLAAQRSKGHARPAGTPAAPAKRTRTAPREAPPTSKNEPEQPSAFMRWLGSFTSPAPATHEPKAGGAEPSASASSPSDEEASPFDTDTGAADTEVDSTAGDSESYDDDDASTADPPGFVDSSVDPSKASEVDDFEME